MLIEDNPNPNMKFTVKKNHIFVYGLKIEACYIRYEKVQA
jgi:hypothetical protein